MTDKENDPFKACRFLLKVGGIILIVYFVYQIFIPFALDALGASSSAKRGRFLQPISWDSNTVDPAQGIFSTLIMSGTYETSDGGSGGFEIVTCGHDFYFKRQWKIFYGGWNWNVEMAMTNYYSRIGINWRGMGSGGGGTSGYGNTKNKLIVARRLWDDSHFVGASTNSLKFSDGAKNFQTSEEFLNLEKFGTYLIPKKIIFRDWNNRQFTYRVERVQFRNDPRETWFLEKAKRFGYSLQEAQKSLSEQSAVKTNN